MNLKWIMLADSYKYSHAKLYPTTAVKLYEYIEARENGEMTWFGMQYFIKKYLLEPINIFDFKMMKNVVKKHMGVELSNEDYEYLIKEHNGYLPVSIKSAPEGLKIPGKNVLATFESTDERLYWAAGLLETLLMNLWYPTTVATHSRSYVNEYSKAAIITSDNTATATMFGIHDFGQRGVSCPEQAILGGMAHLLNSNGTDTMLGVLGAMEYYNQLEIPGFSIPATEHSTITSWGKDDEESAHFNHLYTSMKDKGIMATVCDSFDFEKTVKDIICSPEFIKGVKEKDGKIVVRPDSGDHVSTVLYALETLAEHYGYTVNSKGFKVLNNAGVIQGDGMNLTKVKEVIKAVIKRGYSIENVAFGVGGDLLQGVNRDTFKFAIKACAIQLEDGTWRDVYKAPKGSFKKSKAGRLTLVKEKETGEYKTIRLEEMTDSQEEVLREIYRNGKLLIEENFETIRSRARS